MAVGLVNPLPPSPTLIRSTTMKIITVIIHSIVCDGSRLRRLPLQYSTLSSRLQEIHIGRGKGERKYHLVESRTKTKINRTEQYNTKITAYTLKCNLLLLLFNCNLCFP